MIHSKLPHTGTNIFSLMSKVANDHQAINLSQGFPDFPVSEELIELTAEAMQKGHNQYAPMPGLQSLREIISQKINITGGRKVDPASEITITAGGTGALFASITALIAPRDEVILLEPTYDSYVPAITLAGGIPIGISLAFPDFSVPWKEVRNKITDNTKLILINTPHNPTGSILSAEDIVELKSILNDFPQLLVLSDEVYEHIIFDDIQHESILNHPELASRSIAVFSFGKTFHATGWKTGYVVAPENITIEIRKIHQYLNFSVHTPTQFALAAYLSNAKNYLQLPEFYQSKRDIFLKSIKGTSLQPVKSKGTYFQLLDYSQVTNEKDTEYAIRLAKEFKIAAIPISVFYSNHEDNKLLRFCFAKKEETLVEAGNILRKI